MPVPKGDQTPGTWAWADESQPVGDVTGTETKFGVEFTPVDFKNYKELNKTIIVIVDPATPEASDFDFRAPSDSPMVVYDRNPKVAIVTAKKELMK